MIEPRYSTFGPRLWAGFLDGLIWWPVTLLLEFAFSHSASHPLRAVIFSADSCIFLIYSIWMHGKFGQTLGKMACNVVVLDISERPLSMRQAVLRDIFDVVLLPIRLAIYIPRILHGSAVYANTPGSTTIIEWVLVYSSLVWFAIEVITMLTNNKRRSLHDLIASSVVVRKPAIMPEPTAATL